MPLTDDLPGEFPDEEAVCTAAFVAIGAIASLTATPPITMTPLGTVKSGPLRGEDPRIAEINAYDVLGRRIYVVNPFSRDA